METMDLFDQIGQFLTKKKRSSMFGVSCYKIGRKPFILYYDNQLVCKLFDQIHSEAVQLEGASLFNPTASDKPMKNWVQLPFTHAAKWEYFAKFAYDFVEYEAIQ